MRTTPNLNDMKRWLAITLGVLALVGCSKTPAPVQSDMIESTATSTAIDTAAIIPKISSSISIPADSLALTKYVSGPETEKYLLLSKMQENRSQISALSDKIVRLGFEYEFRADNPGGYNYSDTYTFAISSDLDKFSQWQKQINNLLATNDEIVERLMEGDFNGSGAFYEVKAGKSTYWIFESSGGAITKILKRK